jgi:hypothetical protein
MTHPRSTSLFETSLFPRRQPPLSSRIMWAFAVATLALSAAAPFGQYPVCCPVFRLGLSLRRESGAHVRSCLSGRGAFFLALRGLCRVPIFGALDGGIGDSEGDVGGAIGCAQ